MVRLVVRLSPLAKVGATLGGLGVAVAVYGELSSTHWAQVAGRVLVIGGGLIYLIGRARMLMRARSTRHPE